MARTRHWRRVCTDQSRLYVRVSVGMTTPQQLSRSEQISSTPEQIY